MEHVEKVMKPNSNEVKPEILSILRHKFGKSTTDEIFTILQILYNTREKQINTCHMFVGPFEILCVTVFKFCIPSILYIL